MKKIRILLVDDHPVVLDGLKSSFSKKNDYKVIAVACNGKEAIDKAVKLLPDIILMDISMPVMGGVEATTQLRKILPDIKILILTIYNKKEYINKLFSAGAHGYITKDVSFEELLYAVNTINQGKMFFSPDISNFDAKTNGGDASSDLSESKLSLREKDVLKMLAEGKSNKEVASQLHLSVRTVERHRENIKKKINIHSASELTKFAIKTGMILL